MIIVKENNKINKKPSNSGGNMRGIEPEVQEGLIVDVKW